MSARRSGLYWISDNRLWYRDEELLAGPLFQIEHFAKALNLVRPRDSDLAPLLRILIRTTRDCSFAPGARLLADGTPMRIVTPQKPPKRKAGEP